MKKHKHISIIVLGLLIFSSIHLYSQKDTISEEFEIIRITDDELKGSNQIIEIGDPLYKESNEDDQIFLIVKNMPEFPGGVNALRRYIATHIKYPKITGCIQGSVYLRFEVTNTGEVGKIEIQKGVDPILDKEAIRVIKTLPKFKPGEQSGKKVNVWYSVPITFKLN